jgi:hypothetical protein
MKMVAVSTSWMIMAQRVHAAWLIPQDDGCDVPPIVERVEITRTS